MKPIVDRIILAPVEIQLLQDDGFIVLSLCNANPAFIIDAVSFPMFPSHEIGLRIHETQDILEVDYHLTLAIHVNAVFVVVEYLIGNADLDKPLSPSPVKMIKPHFPHLVERNIQA